ncbi:MAG: hypothetical protein JXR46_03440 [Calditrichaceae bacterium]|nr:hypothetical protein [Calditrichaceae bacterium]MBN2708077.1 hypothetical protein [Calditrichaceae bacterium]RQV92492.1 MAG: hypothetical protein EH224_15320 [Calditrichota bacterium]
MNTINKTVRYAILEKILSSQEFSGSKIYQSYLTYLVDAAEEGHPVKETTIAIDVFGKDADFNPAEDTIVRSHTYLLRKKLDVYYANEGKEDSYHLIIPKGHYEVQFVPKTERTISGNIRKYYPWAVTVLFAFIIIFLGMQIKSLQNQLKNYRQVDSEDPFWKEYFQSNLPVMVVPGDHIFYTDYFERAGRELTVRDFTINSPEELDSLKSVYPQFNIRRSDESYFPYHSIWSIPSVLKVLYSWNIKPIFRKSLDINPQILDEFNFIYIGSIKSLYALKFTLTKSHFHFGIAPHIITYNDPDSNKTITYSTSLHSLGLNEDLVLALKLPGPARNTIFIIASYHSLGTPEIANYFINESKRIELESLFEEKYGYIPKYFEILFRVTGIDKTAYNSEILICNEINE